MMKQLSGLLLAGLCCISCGSGGGSGADTPVKDRFLSFIPDTTGNFRAQWDLAELKHNTKLEQQIGLKDLTLGADSFEIRLWYNFSLGVYWELYVLKCRDSSCSLSYYRVYPRLINYDDPHRNRNWSPREEPVVDSFVSKTVLLSLQDSKDLHTDSVWLLQSQSELGISPGIGFFDCDSYILEVADRKRYKFLRHHCPMGYYEKTKLTQILTFMDFCGRISALAERHNVTVPYNHSYAE